VILLGVTDTDEESDADYLTDKISNLRVFNDENEKMNLSIQDVNGSVLVISQFTLCGDTRKGRRPSFIHAAPPEKGNALYEYFMDQLKTKGVPVESGEFGAMMDVALVNDGPVTFVLDSKSS
jgi:D-tyrosyl-tRNA(Tyr) deacylase